MNSPPDEHHHDPHQGSGRADPHHHASPGHEHHHHHHGHSHTTIKNLKVAFALNFGFALLEIIGGLWTGSVAVLSDAIHDLGDALSLLLAIGFEKIAGKRATPTFSYGFRRFSLLSALLSSSFLLAMTSLVVARAIPRLLHPVQPKTSGMVVFAILGIIVNGYAAWRLTGGRTMNEKVASWHLWEDVLGWVTVLVGALVMMTFDVPIIDPILSLLFSLFIVWNVGRNLRHTLRLFLQGTPLGIDLEGLKKDIESLSGVLRTHDTHLWSLDGESHVLTLHVVVRESLNWEAIQVVKKNIRTLCANRGKMHVTVEVETPESETGCPSLHCV